MTQIETPHDAEQDELAERDPARVDPKTANLLYHDWEARTYDERWSISFDERCISYAKEKFGKAAPVRKYDRVLEIGCGTGFFIINLWQAGLVERPFATDLSPGMVGVCRRNATGVGLEVLPGVASDAEGMPFADDSFDLVVGHAVLHHLPNVRAALAECFRILKPGGILVIAGEPTKRGSKVIAAARLTTAYAFKAFSTVVPSWARPENGGPTDPAAALEAHVDLHEFDPAEVERWASEAGFSPARAQTEELVSGIFGWSVRTIEAMARQGRLGMRWALWAYRNYIRLYRLDDLVVRRLVPREFFYNLLLSAKKPEREG